LEETGHDVTQRAAVVRDHVPQQAAFACSPARSVLTGGAAM
jgi:hypothetical protein